MNIREVLKAIKDSNGSIFSIRFTKRSSGEERTMVCRTGVTSHLRGGETAYDFKEHGLISVFDMQKKEYRTIPIEGITHFKKDGEWVAVAHNSRR